MNKERVCNAIIVENILSNVKEKITFNRLKEEGFTEEDAVDVVTFLTDQYLVTPDLIFCISKQFDIDLNVIYDFSAYKETFIRFLNRELKSAKSLVKDGLKEDTVVNKNMRRFLEGEYASYSQIEIIIQDLKEATIEGFIKELFKIIRYKYKCLQDVKCSKEDYEIAGSLKAYIKFSNILNRFI